MDKNAICTGLAVAGLLGVAGCGGNDSSSDSSTASSTSSSPAATTDAVAIKDFEYAPPSFTVSTGSSVTFTNGDDTSHTATADDTKAFDSGTIAAGKSAKVSFDSAGTFSYYCRFHPFMKGTVTVK